MSLAQRCYVALQYLLPHHLLSWLVYHATRWTWRPWKQLLIRLAVRVFRIDLSQADPPDTTCYRSFNEFFTRPLKPGARPMAEDPDCILCPADGVISQIGAIDGDQILQAKGHHFTLAQLLADDAVSAEFAGGSYATVYLSPRDYHRVHMPLSGELRQTTYVPGRLYSVAPVTVDAIPGLFARNERFVSRFDSPAGPMAVILVGAVMVSSMDCVWCGTVRPGRKVRRQQESGVALDRGEEMGRFNMGSTVILLFGPDAVSWDEALQSGTAVRMGQTLGRRLVDSPDRTREAPAGPTPESEANGDAPGPAEGEASS